MSYWKIIVPKLVKYLISLILGYIDHRGLKSLSKFGNKSSLKCPHLPINIVNTNVLFIAFCQLWLPKVKPWHPLYRFNWNISDPLSKLEYPNLFSQDCQAESNLVERISHNTLFSNCTLLDFSKWYTCIKNILQLKLERYNFFENPDV